jgi:inositol phosphorylceramide mannosyltransferase catalytic subunit
MDLDVECLRPYQVIFDSYSVSTVPYSTHPQPPTLSPNDPRSMRSVFFARMGDQEGFGFSLPNAWMASTPGHPFFLLPLEVVVEKEKTKTSSDKPEELTGPDALHHLIGQYREKYLSPSPALDQKLAESSLNGLFAPMANHHRLEILPKHVIYPFSHVQQEYHDVCWAVSGQHDSEACKKGLHVDLQGSVTISYWRHSW